MSLIKVYPFVMQHNSQFVGTIQYSHVKLVTYEYDVHMAETPYTFYFLHLYFEILLIALLNFLKTNWNLTCGKNLDSFLHLG